MNKKFLSAILFGALAIASTGSFVSCKDYDDDIDSLQSQITNLSSVKGDISAVQSALQGEISAAKAAAETAQKAADAAKAAADAAGSLDAAKAYADAAVATAKAEMLEAANEKLAEAIAGTISADQVEAAIAEAIAGIETVTAADVDGAVSTAVKALKNEMNIDGQLEQMAKDIAALKNQDEALKAYAKSADVTAEIKKAIEGVEAKIAEAINAKTIGEAVKTEVANEVKGINASLNTIVPVRLTSLVFAPKTYINGIEAIEFANLKYQGWTGKKQDAPNLVAAGKAVTYSLATEGATAEYYVSPEDVALKSIKGLSFLSNVATNTRAAKAAISTDVAKAEIKDGKLVLKLKKDDTADWDTPSFTSKSKEEFPIVALKAVLADEVLTAAEKEAKAEVAVFSDWARVVETTSTPIIDNKKVVAHTAHGAWDYVTSRNDDAVKNHFWNYSTVYPTVNHLGETKANPNKTDAKKYIAAHATYKESIDLNTLTQICTFTGTNVSGILNDDPKAAADLGLTIKYELVDYWYQNQEDTKDATNQKLFGKIEGSILTATSENGLPNNADAVGRTPLICATLMDGDKIVDVCYFKIQWDEIVVPATYKVAENATLDPVPFACPGTEYDAWLGETYMNNLYASMLDNAGMTRDQFHTAFPKVMVKSPLETGDYAWTATTGKVQGDLYLGAVTDAAKAAVAKGDMKGFKVIGYITDLADDAELTSTHNVEIKAAAEAINPTKEENFTKDAFFAYKSADGQSYVIVPVKIDVKAGSYVPNYNYLQKNWENAPLETSNINKTRYVNPTLVSDATKGEDGFVGGTGFFTTQLIGDFTMGYMKDSQTPKDVKNLYNYKAGVGSTVIPSNTEIIFDESRFAEMAAQNGTKAADWTVDATKKILYYTVAGVKTKAAVIDGNNVYLVDNKSTLVTDGAIDAEPTTGALLLVWDKGVQEVFVPVVVNGNHCEVKPLDQYKIRFVQPLTVVVNESGITLKDVQNYGSKDAVGLEDQYSLREAFGSETPIYLFGTKAATAENKRLIQWYEITGLSVNLPEALINIADDGSTTTDKSKYNKLVKVIHTASGERVFDIIGLDNAGNEITIEDIIATPAKASKVVKIYYHNNHGDGIGDDTLEILVPVTMQTKWKKNVGKDQYIKVTVLSNNKK